MIMKFEPNNFFKLYLNKSSDIWNQNTHNLSRNTAVYQLKTIQIQIKNLLSTKIKNFKADENHFFFF